MKINHSLLLKYHRETTDTMKKVVTCREKKDEKKENHMIVNI
jgi:hypothetical protein